MAKPVAPAATDHASPRTWRQLLAPLLVHRVLVALFVAAVPSLLPRLFQAGNYARNFHDPPDAPVTLIRHFTSWDAEHYVFLAQHGYAAGQPSNRMWPLWPWLIRAGSWLFGGNAALAAIVLANALAVLAALLFHRVVADQHGARRADGATLLLLVFPGALFLSLPYSESLFVVLCLGWYLALRRGRLGVAAACAALLPLVRLVGVCVAVPMAYEVGRRMRASGKLTPVQAVAVLAPLAGFAAYLLFMRAAVGDAFAAFVYHRAIRDQSSQALLGRTAHGLVDVGAFLAALTGGRDLVGPLTSAVDRVWFLLLLPALAVLWRRDRTQFLFALALGVVPAVGNLFFGYTRYVLPVFPLFILGAEVLEKPGRGSWRTLALALLFALQVVFLARHTSYHWVA